jgi:hypothetical protein
MIPAEKNPTCTREPSVYFVGKPVIFRDPTVAVETVCGYVLPTS